MHVLILNAHTSAALGDTLQQILASARSAHVDHLKQPLDHIESLSAFGGNIAERVKAADIVFILCSCSSGSGISDLVSRLNKIKQNLPVIMVSDVTCPDTVIQYLRSGIADYLTSPLRDIDILPRVWRLVEHAQRSSTLLHSMKTRIGLRQLIGDSPSFREVIDCIPMVAQSDVGVRISGETGTGKELCARAIHYLGPRADKPFLPVNCGAIPSDLVENELFGHIRGAFTGATLSHGGLISEANNGTLFLDEIDCLPLPAQTKLLRFVQEKEFRQLGSAKVKRADVRIIAATNTDLEEAVRAGTFRQDLFYRLNVVHLSLPPLRERRADIPLLARHFLAQYTADEGKGPADFSPEALQRLSGYGWSGNVREIENVVRRAVLFAKGDRIQESDLALPRPAATTLQESFKAEKAKVVAEFEREYLQGLLRTYQGNITQASRAAQKNRRAFWELMRKHQIDVESFRSPAPKS